MKLELFNNYKKTMKKISDMQNEEEYNDHDYIENTESQDVDGDIGYVQKVTNYVKINKDKLCLYINVRL